MKKEIYEIKYVKGFLNEVVHPILLKEGKLLYHRPIEYQITRIKDEKKRSYNFVLDFSQARIKHKIEGAINFRVTAKKFTSSEYDFSDKWQAYQLKQENIQTI